MLIFGRVFWNLKAQFLITFMLKCFQAWEYKDYCETTNGATWKPVRTKTKLYIWEQIPPPPKKKFRKMLKFHYYTNNKSQQIFKTLIKELLCSSKNVRHRLMSLFQSSLTFSIRRIGCILWESSHAAWKCSWYRFYWCVYEIQGDMNENEKLNKSHNQLNKFHLQQIWRRVWDCTASLTGCKYTKHKICLSVRSLMLTIWYQD